MSVGKSESLLRRDARAFCNKRHQRTIWEARRDERRTNQQLERELRLLERSRAYRERELDRDQVTFLNNFVEIFQRQCDIVAERKSLAVDIEPPTWKDRHGADGTEQDESQYDAQYEDYLEGGQDSMTVTTSDHVTSDMTSGIHDKADENSEINAVAQHNRRKLLIHRDSLLPILYSPCPSGNSTPKYSSRPNSPRPVVTSPSETCECVPDENADVIKQDDQPLLGASSPDQGTPRSAIQSPPRGLKTNVSAPVYRRRLSPLSRYKMPESHFRADSPSSKNSTVYVNDVPDLGESIRGERVHRRKRLPLPPSKANCKSSGGARSSRQESRQKKRDLGSEVAKGTAAEETNLNTKFMLEFEEASRNALDPYATGTDIENIRKQFLVNTLAKKLKISALRSGHFAELDDIRKKIERRRKCVEEILETRRKERLAAAAAAAAATKETLSEEHDTDTESQQ